ncbi:hypothetical protein [Hominifimenecus sp. rT4P-3]|uniref:hypothetical protein n=1 Tax=Hominifimenecus sp. rT4P-3 TaxID=3242979 RepID=UPI003DA52B0B
MPKDLPTPEKSIQQLEREQKNYHRSKKPAPASTATGHVHHKNDDKRTEKAMETQIVYCDETGDDGLNTSSSESFILTSIYMPSSSWQDNYDTIKTLRSELKKEYGFLFVKKCIQSIF